MAYRLSSLPDLLPPDYGQSLVDFSSLSKRGASAPEWAVREEARKQQTKPVPVPPGQRMPVPQTAPSPGLFGQGIPQGPPGIPSGPYDFKNDLWSRPWLGLPPGGQAPGMADRIMSLQPSDPGLRPSKSGLHLLGLGARPLGLPGQGLPPGPPGPPGISPGLPPSPSPLQPTTGLGIPGLSAIGTPGGLSPLGTGLQPAIGTPGAPMPLPQQQAAPSALPFPNQFTGLGQGNIPPGGIGTFGNAFRGTLQWPFGPR
jgi:hypothetical protein